MAIKRMTKQLVKYATMSIRDGHIMHIAHDKTVGEVCHYKH